MKYSNAKCFFVFQNFFFSCLFQSYLLSCVCFSIFCLYFNIRFSVSLQILSMWMAIAYQVPYGVSSWNWLKPLPKSNLKGTMGRVSVKQLSCLTVNLVRFVLPIISVKSWFDDKKQCLISMKPFSTFQAWNISGSCFHFTALYICLFMHMQVSLAICDGYIHCILQKNCKQLDINSMGNTGLGVGVCRVTLTHLFYTVL